MFLIVFCVKCPAEFPGNVDKLRHASLTEVNQFVIAKYKEFTASDIGTARPSICDSIVLVMHFK
jgi:hypothetical protein